MKKIRSEAELVDEMKCSDLCFIKDRLSKKELAEDKIRDSGCPC